MKKPKNPIEKEKEMEQQMMQPLNESYQSGSQKRNKR